jgi:hypothetical protein
MVLASDEVDQDSIQVSGGKVCLEAAGRESFCIGQQSMRGVPLPAWQPPTASPESSKKVASWASLFQNKEENSMVEKSQIGQYSCMKLLREMEMAESESDEEPKNVESDDLELARIPEKWCQMLGSSEMAQLLPEDLYSIPEAEIKARQEADQNEVAATKIIKPGNQARKWGHVLVEKRQSRMTHDGRSILEIAQGRKKKTNLEVSSGMTNAKYPPSSNFVTDVVKLAEVT